MENINQEFQQEQSKFKLSPATIIIIALILFVLLFLFFKASSPVAKPEIKIKTPTEQGMSEILPGVSDVVVNTPTIQIQGRVQNVVEFTANGEQVFLDADGNFSHTLVLHEGVNPVEFVAKDKFGKVTTKTIRIIYQPATQEEGVPQDENVPEDMPTPVPVE